MRKQILSFALLIVFLIIMFTPVLAYDSSSWSYTMYYRVVDGKANGEFHYLDSGSMTISGSLTAFDKIAGATPSPNTVYFRVMEDVFGIDRVVGTAARTPSSTLNYWRSFSSSFGTQPGGKYYLFIYTAEDDGWDTTGHGTLVTN